MKNCSLEICSFIKNGVRYVVCFSEAMVSCFRSTFLQAFCKKGVLRPATLLKQKTLTQVFSYEFCEISKSAYSYRTPPVAASVV